MNQNKQRNFYQPLLFGGLMSLGVGFPFYRVLFSTRAWYWKVAAFCLLLVTIAIWGKSYTDTRQFARSLNAYGEKYQLDPVKLAAITGFSRYDFSYGKKHELLFLNGWPKNRKKVLAALATTFGKI